VDIAHGFYHPGSQYVGAGAKRMEKCKQKGLCHGNNGDRSNYFIGAYCGIWEFHQTLMKHVIKQNKIQIR
jgi:hypothetical protein